MATKKKNHDAQNSIMPIFDHILYHRNVKLKEILKEPKFQKSLNLDRKSWEDVSTNPFQLAFWISNYKAIKILLENGFNVSKNVF